MAERFRFSPRPNRAGEIHWREWGEAAFDEAARTDRPVLLNLTAVWCQWCHRMDETTYSDPGLIERINAELIPIRVDADRYPHVQDRYIAGGWPTNAFLTPSGEVLWAGTYVPADEFRTVADGVLTAWRDRRPGLAQEIERRRKALEAARSRRPAVGLIRREAADDVLTVMQDSFDVRNGGFGTAPKFPHAEAIELLFAQAERTGNPDWSEMAVRTLDGMLAGELWDSVEGGFFRYALEPDWTAVRFEKLLDVNAGMLRAFALGAHLKNRADWREVAERTVAWVDETLGLEGGLWAGSQDADEAYFALDAEARRGREAPYVDPTRFASANAHWIRSLAEAGARLGRTDWVERAADALDTLYHSFVQPDGLLCHFHGENGGPAVTGLLIDTLDAARAAVAVAQATGRGDVLELARRLASALEDRLWADEGGFFDHVSTGADVAALRYRDRPFEANASAARLFNDLTLATGERSYRAMAERTLALLSPLAGRYGVAGAEFALAVEEYFEAPLQIVVVGPPDVAAPLRTAALALPEASRRVWSMERGGRIGPLRFQAADTPVAYVCGGRTCSAPVAEPGALAATVEAVR